MRTPSLRRARLTAALLITGGLVAAVLVPSSATAATSAAVQVMAGDRTITAAWPASPGATRYSVRVSPDRGKARTVITGDLSARLGGLTNGTPYSVVVTPMVAGRTAAATLRTARATPAAGVPLPVDRVTVTPGEQPNTVRVTWTGGSRAVKVGVIAGSNPTVDDRAFHSSWYPATTRSILLTVPAQYRSQIGGGTGSPVYVRVVQSNSGSQTFHTTFNLADRYRTSTIGSWAFAGTTSITEPVTRLRVAALNTQTNGSTEDFSRDNQWPARAPRVAKLITAQHPDLVLTAELSSNRLRADNNRCNYSPSDPERCAYLMQYRQLAALMPSLSLADPDAYARVMHQMDTYGSRFKGRSTSGAHIFYNPATLTLLDHGFFSPALKPSESFANVTGLGVPNWEQTPDIGGDRWLSWAKLRTNDGTTFYAVAAHLPSGDSTPVINTRAAEAGLAEAAISRMAGGLPVVFGGDFNSDPTRNPNTAHAVFMQRGWFDTAATPARTNMRYNTVNASGPQTGADPGYPLRPYLQKWPTSRIDYVLVRNSPHSYRYENVLPTTANGSFDRSMQGTDHNLQLATIGIAARTQ